MPRTAFVTTLDSVTSNSPRASAPEGVALHPGSAFSSVRGQTGPGAPTPDDYEACDHCTTAAAYLHLKRDGKPDQHLCVQCFGRKMKWANRAQARLAEEADE